MVSTKMELKLLPLQPYWNNVCKHWNKEHINKIYDFSAFKEWQKEIGIKRILYGHIEFVDDFTNKDLLMFILKWG